MPVPDPTKLTTDQLHRELDIVSRELRREMESMQLLMNSRMNAMEATSQGRLDMLLLANNDMAEAKAREHVAMREIIETRLDAEQRALEYRVVSFGDRIGQITIDRAAAVAGLKELLESRLNGIESRGRDTAATADKAIAAALIAARELVTAQGEASAAAAGKAELSFTKQIDGLSARITEVKERLDRGEGAETGSATFRTERRLDTGVIISSISVFLVLIAITVSVITALHKGG